jgi:hypothetical protein
MLASSQSKAASITALVRPGYIRGGVVQVPKIVD